MLVLLRHVRRGAVVLAGLGVLAGCSTGARHQPGSMSTTPLAATPTPSPSAEPLPDASDPSTPFPSPSAVRAASTDVPRLPVALADSPWLTDVSHPPVVYRVPTSRRVVFLTVDDGWTRDPGFLTMVAKAGVPVSTFLIGQALSEDPSYWTRLSGLGATVEDHTLTHPRLTALTTAQQQSQICGDADLVARTLGRRPALVRPPYGSWDAGTVVAAARCRMAAVVLWDVSVVQGRLHFAVGSSLRPGDVLLLHFTPWIRVDFAAALQAVQRAGYAVGRLEDFVRPAPAPSPSRTPSARPPSATPSPSPRPSSTPSRTPTPTPTPTRTPSPSASPTPSPTST